MKDQLLTLLEMAIDAARKAAVLINEVYAKPIAVAYKDDMSPLTLADTLSQRAISDVLKDSGLPQIGEESRLIAFSERQHWPMCWIVDPLDGTKEFINRNGEFCISIGLVKEGKAVLGVLFSPLSNDLYCGIVGYGAFEVKGLAPADTMPDVKRLLSDSSVQQSEREIALLASRSHMNEETTSFIERCKQLFPGMQILHCGSAMKFAKLAFGYADIYPRFAPTKEWDTAAGQAILEATGGQVISWPERKMLVYNKESLINPFFLAINKAVDINWLLKQY